MRIAFNRITLEIIQVIEDDSSVTVFPPDEVEVIQAPPDTIRELAMVIGLDVAKIPGPDVASDHE